MGRLTRWIVYYESKDGERELGWAFSQAGARQIAYHYMCHPPVFAKDPDNLNIRISLETINNNL